MALGTGAAIHFLQEGDTVTVDQALTVIASWELVRTKNTNDTVSGRSPFESRAVAPKALGYLAGAGKAIDEAVIPPLTAASFYNDLAMTAGHRRPRRAHHSSFREPGRAPLWGEGGFLGRRRTGGNEPGTAL